MKNKHRLERELFWIKCLQTPYPLGLNDTIYRLGNISRITSIDIFDLFNYRKRNNRSHGIKKNGNVKRKVRKNLNVAQCHSILVNSGRHRLLSSLNNLSVKSLKSLNEEADQIIIRTNPLYTTASIIQSYALHKLFPHIDKDDEHKRRFFPLKFINKGMDFIDLSRILNDKNCTKLIPGYFTNKESPIISYSYTNPIRSSIFNYNELVSDIDLNLDKTGPSCDCHNSKFCYRPAGHIITGNFDILNNQRLKDIFTKGPKYRLPTKINFVKCLEHITDALNNFINVWCKRENVENAALENWKTFILSKIKGRIEFYLSNPNLLPPEPTYNLTDFKCDLKDLHKKFVFAPADKAANNVIIICRKYYIDILRKEIISTKTYNSTDLTEKEIIKNHINACNKFDVKLDTTVQNVPTIYWIPKLHKSPYKSRFIANSISCSTKQLSILLTSCLTLIKSHWKKYCDTVYQNSGKKLFWSIKNSGEFLAKLENKRFIASSVSTYDFSTLYTSLPHKLIKEKLLKLVRDTFKRENQLFIACNNSRAFFTSIKYNKYHMFDQALICEAVEFLLDNIFIRIGKTIYRQVIGIPMGTNCAPLIADLFLFCYEKEFMLKLDTRNQADVILSFNDTSRYLDDICNLDNHFFSSMFKDIYPSELELNKANTVDTNSSFLDLNISIINGKVSTSIYDKRDDFNFQIVNYPNLSGNIPSSPSYGVYISQLIRFTRCCSNVEDFHKRNHCITKKLLQQGYRFHKLRMSFKKFFIKYKTALSKYNCSMKTFLKLGISHPHFYGDVVYKLRKIKNVHNFQYKFTKIIAMFLKRNYNKPILQTSAEKVFSKRILSSFSHLF